MQKSLITGFELGGHADFAAMGKDIVCAAVSSASYMTLNTLLYVSKADFTPQISDGHIKAVLGNADAVHSQELLKGFELHLRELSKEYPRSIKLIYGGNKNA